MKYVTVDAEVDINLEDFSTDELLDEVYSRGIKTIEDDDALSVSETAHDAIYTLYRDWISLDGKRFEERLKRFFEDYTGKLVV